MDAKEFEFKSARLRDLAVDEQLLIISERIHAIQEECRRAGKHSTKSRSLARELIRLEELMDILTQTDPRTPPLWKEDE